MAHIVNMLDYAGGLDAAIAYYHAKWGRPGNLAFFADAIRHSTNAATGLPRFYVALNGDAIVGCCGLIVNDFISRHDLLPWLCGLFVEPSERGHDLGNALMEHALADARGAGYATVYLSTDHDGYYERYGWTRIEDGYELSGVASRIYRKVL